MVEVGDEAGDMLREGWQLPVLQEEHQSRTGSHLPQPSLHQPVLIEFFIFGESSEAMDVVPALHFFSWYGGFSHVLLCCYDHAPFKLLPVKQFLDLASAHFTLITLLLYRFILQ